MDKTIKLGEGGSDKYRGSKISLPYSIALVNIYMSVMYLLRNLLVIKPFDNIFLITYEYYSKFIFYVMNF